METDLKVKLSLNESIIIRDLRTDVRNILNKSEDMFEEHSIMHLVREIESIRDYLSNMPKHDKELEAIYRKLVKLVSDYDLSVKSINTMENDK